MNALCLALLALQEPDAAARYDSALARWKQAAAVDARYDYRMELPAEDGGPGDLLEGFVQVHLARPLNGFVSMLRNGARIEYVADGAMIHAVNHERRTYVELGARLADIPYALDLLPLRAALGLPLAQPVSVEWLPADAARPAAAGLRLILRQGHQDLWLDQDNALVAAAIAYDSYAAAVVRLQFLRWHTHSEVEIQDYAARPPEDYCRESLFGGSAGAAPGVGTRAPAVVLPVLDGEPQPLSGLAGKAVLLNFWSYH